MAAPAAIRSSRVAAEFGYAYGLKPRIKSLGIAFDGGDDGDGVSVGVLGGEFGIIEVN